MDKQQKAYCRAVRRALRCPARERKALLDRLAADMAGQFGPQASPTRRELVEAFGPPETLAAEYMESMDAAVLARYEQSRLRRGRILRPVPTPFCNRKERPPCPLTEVFCIKSNRSWSR